MSTRARRIRATPDVVWDVLADGWTYPVWVVGATRMRDVDPGWPAVGARLHHSVGAWPAILDDTTEVLHCEPGRRLTLRARGWPSGEAQVDLELLPDGAVTVVRIHEDVVRGPGTLVPAVIRHPLIAWRNGETLRRLAAIAEGRDDVGR